MHKRILGLWFLAIVCACGSSGRSSSSGSGGDSSGAGGNGACPATKAYTGQVCHEEDMGPTCPGMAACFCQEPINIDTTCVCQNDPNFGLSWKCGDDCASACSGSGGGGGGGVGGSGPPPATCADYCAHLEAANCPMNISGCEDVCKDLAKPGCEKEMDAYLNCASKAPVVCDPQLGYPVPQGCQAEDQAFADCK